MSLLRKVRSVVMAAMLAGCAGSKPAPPITDPWYALTGCCTFFFAAGSAEIDRQNFLKVQDLARNVARYSKNAETTRWCISGHTDFSGDDNANPRLSTERATAVAERLTALGVAQENLEVRGYGSARSSFGQNVAAYRPAQMERHRAEPEPQDRRVEVRPGQCPA